MSLTLPTILNSKFNKPINCFCDTVLYTLKVNVHLLRLGNQMDHLIGSFSKNIVTVGDKIIYLVST